MAGLYKVLTGRPSGKGNRYAEKIQTEEISLWGISGGGDLSSIHQGKGEREQCDTDVEIHPYELQYTTMHAIIPVKM